MAAVRAISRGMVSKAAGLLESKGLADATDPRVQAQLKAKHPARMREVPAPTSDQHLVA